MLTVWGSETEEYRKANIDYFYGQLELSTPGFTLKNNNNSNVLECPYLKPENCDAHIPTHHSHKDIKFLAILWLPAVPLVSRGSGSERDTRERCEARHAWELTQVTQGGLKDENGRKHDSQQNFTLFKVDTEHLGGGSCESTESVS